MAYWNAPVWVGGSVLPRASDHSSMLKPWTWSQGTPHSLRKKTVQRYMPMGPTGRMRASGRPSARACRISRAFGRLWEDPDVPGNRLRHSGLIHQDLKRERVADRSGFAVRKDSGTGPTQTGAVRGMPANMAPIRLTASRGRSGPLRMTGRWAL